MRRMYFSLYSDKDVYQKKWCTKETRHQQKASKGRQKMDQETGEEMENKSS